MKNLLLLRRTTPINDYDHHGMLSYDSSMLIIDRIKFYGKADKLRATQYYGFVVKDGMHFIQIFNSHGTDLYKTKSIKDLHAEAYILPLTDNTQIYSVAIRQGTEFTNIAKENNIRIHYSEFCDLMGLLQHNEIISIMIVKWGRRETDFLPTEQ